MLDGHLEGRDVSGVDGFVPDVSNAMNRTAECLRGLVESRERIIYRWDRPSHCCRSGLEHFEIHIHSIARWQLMEGGNYRDVH